MDTNGRGTESVTLHTLKLAALTALGAAPASGLNKFNLVGSPHQRGTLELQLDVAFTVKQRAVAARALSELQSAAFIVPTFRDVVAPGDWLTITDSGREALGREALDARSTMPSRKSIRIFFASDVGLGLRCCRSTRTRFVRRRTRDESSSTRSSKMDRRTMRFEPNRAFKRPRGARPAFRGGCA